MTAGGLWCGSEVRRRSRPNDTGGTAMIVLLGLVVAVVIWRQDDDRGAEVKLLCM